jgi:hypothetical protein
MMGFAARLANVGREPLVPGHTASANQRAGIGPEEKAHSLVRAKPRALICDCFALFLNNFPDRLLGRTIKIRFSS